MRIARLMAALGTLSLALTARADNLVTTIRQTHAMLMPDEITISVRASPVFCTDNWLSYRGGTADTRKAIYALVLTAQLTGKSVYVDYNPATCTINYISLWTQ